MYSKSIKQEVSWTKFGNAEVKFYIATESRIDQISLKSFAVRASMQLKHHWLVWCGDNKPKW